MIKDVEIQNYLEQIAKQYSKLEQVKAVVLAGSVSSHQNDNLSDYDIYVYSDKEIPVTFRNELAKKYSNKYETDNRYFETGDEWILKDSKICFDFMFRSTDWIQNEINKTLREYNASNGYTTCFLYNIQNSQILYEKENWFSDIQKQLKIKYPPKLKKNIIKRNIMLICDKQNASYYEQIEKAINRNDLISINHRITAFFASYFDIIFAINEIYHPGEKRLIKYCKENCKILPQNFEENITELMSESNNKKTKTLNNIIKELKEILP